MSIPVDRCVLVHLKQLFCCYYLLLSFFWWPKFKRRIVFCKGERDSILLKCTDLVYVDVVQ